MTELRAGRSRRVLGIDPGTSCGWAIWHGEKRSVEGSGVLSLKPRRHEGAGMRYVKLRASLEDLIRTWRPEVLAYEEVRRHAGTSAAHVYGGIVAVIQALCEDLALPYQGLPVASVKKFATGKGNAGKPAMVAAARVLVPQVQDDNEADAIHIARCCAAGLW